LERGDVESAGEKMTDWVLEFSDAASDYARAVERLLARAIEEGTTSTARAILVFEKSRSGMCYTASLLKRIQEARVLVDQNELPPGPSPKMPGQLA